MSEKLREALALLPTVAYRSRDGANYLNDATRKLIADACEALAAIPTSGGVEGLEPGDLEWLQRDAFQGWSGGAAQPRIDRILSALSAVPGRIDLEALGSVAGLADANSALPVCLEGDATPSGANSYRKRPIVIEARRFNDGAEGYDLLDWINRAQYAAKREFAQWINRRLIIPTLEGDHRADPGDWIIRGIAGEFYPCKPDIFAATYEPVEGVASKPDDTREASKPKARATEPNTCEPRIDLEEAAADPHADRGVEDAWLARARHHANCLEENAAWADGIPALEKSMLDAAALLREAFHSLPSTAWLSERGAKPADQDGWLYESDDYPVEWNQDHPIESGECPDAKDVRPATAGALRGLLLNVWSDLGELRAKSPSPREAGLREALEGGFCTTTSLGNPDPEKRKAVYQVEFRGGDAVDKLHRLDDAVRAIMGSAR